MTAANTGQAPTLPLHGFGQLLARNLFHRANSIMRSFSASPVAVLSTESHSSMASRKLAVSSASVSPWVTQPGKAGTSAQKPPSSAGWMIALTFMPPLYQRLGQSQAPNDHGERRGAAADDVRFVAEPDGCSLFAPPCGLDSGWQSLWQ